MKNHLIELASLFAVLASAFLFCGSTCDAQTSSRIYLAPDDHTDYFWTGDDVEYRAAFLEMLDYYLDLADRTKDAPPEYQSRWNCDGSLWVWEYEKNKTPAEFKRLIERIRSGHISMPMTALANTYGCLLYTSDAADE